MPRDLLPASEGFPYRRRRGTHGDPVPRSRVDGARWAGELAVSAPQHPRWPGTPDLACLHDLGFATRKPAWAAAARTGSTFASAAVPLSAPETSLTAPRLPVEPRVVRCRAHSSPQIITHIHPSLMHAILCFTKRVELNTVRPAGRVRGEPWQPDARHHPSRRRRADLYRFGSTLSSSSGVCRPIGGRGLATRLRATGSVLPWIGVWSPRQSGGISPSDHRRSPPPRDPHVRY